MWEKVECPYPGLRPFDPAESEIFFGRERHCDDVISRLAASRFVSVIGPSGCGKSSLLRAGVMHELQAGRFYRAGSRWKLALMRPENQPSWNLAMAFDNLHPAPTGMDDHRRLMLLSTELLHEPEIALEELRARPGFDSNANILLVVDQFEELFKAENDGQKRVVEAFIGFLLKIYRGELPNTYCIMTMRSDHLGDCSSYPELAEAVNRTFYLTPNLTETEIKEAIELPSQAFNGAFEAGLVDRIYDDMSIEAADQLPLMQHVLMLMWKEARQNAQGPDAHVRLTHALYGKYGPIAQSLEKHADRLMANLDASLVELLFRQITERRPGTSSQDVRRPTRFGELVEITGLTTPEQKEKLRAVVDRFRASDALFLQPFTKDQPVSHDEMRIDIVHECLIRKWPRLRGWLQAEYEAGRELIELSTLAAEAKARSGDEVVATKHGWLTRLPKAPGANTSADTGSAALGLSPPLEVLANMARASAKEARLRAGAAWQDARSRSAELKTLAATLRQSPDGRKRALRVAGEWIDDIKTAATSGVNRSMSWLRGSSYLDRRSTARFELWQRRWNSERLPNAAWARNYKVEGSSFGEAIGYLRNSRWHRTMRQFLMGVVVSLALVVCAGFASWILQKENFAWQMVERTQKARQEEARQMMVARARVAWAPYAIMDDGRPEAGQYLDALGPYKGDRKIESWLRLQKSMIAGQSDLELSSQSITKPTRVDGLDGSITALSVAGNYLAVRSGSSVVVSSLPDRKALGQKIEIPADEPAWWIDAEGQVRWVLASGTMFTSRPGTSLSSSPIGAGLKVGRVAISSDKATIAVIGRREPDGRIIARVVDVKTSKSIDHVLELQDADLHIGPATIGGAQNRRLALVMWKDVPQGAGPDSAMSTTAIWDLQSEGKDQAHLAYRLRLEFKPQGISLSPDGISLAYVNLPGISIHHLGRPDAEVKDQLIRPPPNFDLNSKGNLLAIEFVGSDQIIMVTSRGDVLLWPYRIQRKSTPVFLQEQNVGAAAVDPNGTVHFATDSQVGQVDTTQRFGLPTLDALAEKGAQLTAIAIEPLGNRVVYGRSDGRLTLRRLVSGSKAVRREGQLAPVAPIDLPQPDASDEPVVSVGFARLADGRALAVGVTVNGTLVTAFERTPGKDDFSLRRSATGQTGISSLGLSHNGEAAVLLQRNGELVLLSRSGPIEEGFRPDRLVAPEPALSMALMESGRALAIGTPAGRIYYTQLAGQKSSPSWREIASFKCPVGELKFSPSGEFLLAGTHIPSSEHGGCSSGANDELSPVILRTETGNWSNMGDVKRLEPRSSDPFAYGGAVAHPLGNMFLLTRWRDRQPIVRIIDAEPWRLGIDEQIEDGWRTSINLRFSIFDDEAPRRQSHLACDKQECWMLTPLTRSQVAITPVKFRPIDSE